MCAGGDGDGDNFRDEEEGLPPAKPRTGSGASGMNNRAAVILLDFQNEFAKEGGKLHDDVKDMMEETGMLEKVPGVVRAARAAGACVIHSPVIMKTGVRFVEEDFDPHAYSSMDGLFTEGTWNAQFIDEVQPEGLREHILTGRNNFSAFEGTRLLDILRSEGVSTLILCGFLSNLCIQETAAAAIQRMPGLRVVVTSDGCAAKSRKEHDTAVSATAAVLGIEVMTCSEAEHVLAAVSLAPGIDETADLLQNPPTKHVRPRILATHGARANNEVTRLQLNNLGITSKDYDIEYLRGPIPVEGGDPDLEAAGIRGPFYSWFAENGDNKGESVVAAVRDILRAARSFGPFDGAYAFSSGAAALALAAGVASDPDLIEAVEAFENREAAENRGKSVVRRLTMATSATRRVTMANSTTKTTVSSAGQRKTLRRGTLFNAAPPLDSAALAEPPFKFVILGCAGTSFPGGFAEMRSAAGLRRSHFDTNSCRVPSFHLIGIEDPLKSQSEDFASLFGRRRVLYMPGGHAIGRGERGDADLTEQLYDFASSLGDAPPRQVNEASFRPVSEVSDIALLPHVQVALVKLKNTKLPWAHGGGATLLSMFKKHPPTNPFLRVSREPDPSKTTTYGDFLNFVRGGPGDLRHIGVRPGQVVAYGAPPGGGAVPAVAFLSIGAQTAAAPLAPGTAEPDALDALEQFGASHLVLFEGVVCPGVTAAFEAYAAQGNAVLHRARILGDDKPGLFEFIIEGGAAPLEGQPFTNAETGTCLLLRTSGTTARPKGVPLRQDELVANGAILAASMRLTPEDVVYSVMPLFHIGGISASILCTLAVGGSVCCDGEPFDPSRMVDALALSRPQPTWYSSVPTIHNATVAFLKSAVSLDADKYASYGIDEHGIWKSGHSLRMIRSGAAALLGPDSDALSAAYGGTPIYPTYSMSEQMPISQPPAGKGNTLTDKPGSVGVPVAASTAIVSRSTLRPVPHGEEGEIAISGPTVLKKYLNNPAADAKSYFDLTLDIGSNILGDATTGGRYFLTGDVGTLDREGFLSLKGRAKELIKKGGEQVSPFEVEEPLLEHPWVQTPICFAVPSKLYGEEVGCALVLSGEVPVETADKATEGDVRDIIKAMRQWLKGAKLAPIKWPTKWIVVKDEDLPKTKTKKYIRIGLSTKLGLDPDQQNKDADNEDAGNADGGKKPDSSKAKIAWPVLGGLRMFLACYVMFMHIGSTDSWGRMNNLRGFPWHVHLFFTLGGYSMASPMNPVITKKFAYFKARIWNMYPMYLLALALGLVNLLVVCRPSTFDPNFTWDGQGSEDKERGLFCQGTPATPKTYWGSLILTIVTYIFGIAVTPTWLITWWMGYYLWFSSMYYQCLAFFPATYNAFFTKTQKNVKKLLFIVVGLMTLNAIILVAAWFGFRDGAKYPADPVKNPEQYTAARNHNIAILSFYLFGPFWALYFVIGSAAAFLYDAVRPAERHNARMWGWVADACSATLILVSALHIAQGKSTYVDNKDLEMFMRPEEADQWTDAAATNRIWDMGYARMFCPLTTLWVFALSTGEGFTAKFFSWKFLSETLSPNSYNCFLFHQMVAQWYYAATRKGAWWNWWNFRKKMYWFSPQPCPTEWYEYFLVVGCVVAFSQFLTALEPKVGEVLDKLRVWIKGGEDDEAEDVDTAEVLMDIVEGMTGIEPQTDWTLDECGLASIGLPVLVGLLNKNFSKKNRQVAITPADLVSAETIADMVEVVDNAKSLANHQGV